MNHLYVVMNVPEGKVNASLLGQLEAFFRVFLAAKEENRLEVSVCIADSWE